jgi:hypothetical protein
MRQLADKGWCFFIGLFALYIFLLHPRQLSAQIVMSNGSATTCDENFFDSSIFGNYANNENYTLTIYPATSGESLQVIFLSFNTEAGLDLLRIYNGNSVAAPLIGTYSGVLTPFSVTSTAADGSLTFRFTSNNNQRRAGWFALLDCTNSGYCAASSTNANFEYIGQVNGAGLSLFTGSGYYTNQTDEPPLAGETPGTSFDIDVVVVDPFATDSIWVFVDFNQDGDFNDPFELAARSGVLGVFTAELYTLTINIPPDAALGTTRVRIKVGDASSGTVPANSSPCQLFTYGEVEDYVIWILDGLDCSTTSLHSEFEYISQVSSTGLTNASGSLLYADYTGLPPLGTMSESSWINIIVSVTDSYITDSIWKYLDANYNGILDYPSELVGEFGEFTGATNPEVVSVPVFIPPGTAEGTTWMRIKLGDTFYDVSDDPCEVSFDFGEVEDYLFTIDNTVLPIELIAFEAYLIPDGVRLDWQTASEQNSSYFEVNRSVDGVNWSAIGQVTAAGTSLEELNYTFSDLEAPYGGLYYQLLQVDADGTEENSPVVFIYNPEVGNLIVFGYADLSGRRLASLEQAPPGIYIAITNIGNYKIVYPGK